MAIKKCAICGNEFDTRGKGKYCPDCKHGPCAICGTDIVYSEYQLKQVAAGKPVSCSDKCRAQLTKRNLMEREGIENVSQRESMNHKSYKRICRKCGREFEGGKTAKYCPDCKKVTCPVCGKVFEPGGPQFSKYLKQGWLTCGSSSCRVEITRRNLMEREGIVNVGQREEVRKASRQARLNDSDETKEKRSAAIKKAWGDPATLEQSRKTRADRYGGWISDEHHEKMVAAAATPESRRKAIETRAAHYNGAKTPFQDPEVIKRIIGEREERAKKEAAIIADYMAAHEDAGPRDVERNIGIGYFRVLTLNKRYDLGVKLYASQYEGFFAELLDDAGLEYEKHFRLPYDGGDRRSCPEYDFRVGDTFVEIDPYYTHNSTKVPFHVDGKLKDCGYHKSKSDHAIVNGYRCIHVFDWDDYIDIVRMLAGDEFDCDVLELPGVLLVNGDEIVCDDSKCADELYESFGYELIDRDERPHVHWYNPATSEHLVDGNRDVLLAMGFLEIYDCGQSRWAYRP